MGKRDREHRLAVINGQDKPFRQVGEPVLYMFCGKCKTRMSESRVTDHLKECQPQGVQCANCKQIFKPEDFLTHFKACVVRKASEMPDHSKG